MNKSAHKSNESSTAILTLIKNLKLTNQEGLVAILVAFVRLAKHMKKTRWEVRKLFNQLAQEFPDEGPPKEAFGKNKIE